MKFSKLFCKDVSSTIVSIYLILIFGVYPFYMKEGYVQIDAAKYNFFLYLSLITIILLIITGIIDLLKHAKEQKLSMYNASLFLFLIISTLSFLFSKNKNTAFYGTNGWFMGLLILLTVILMSYLISVLWNPNKMIYLIMISVFTVVMVIALLDRFSFYLINLEVRNSSFLSTIGNINWLAGYYSVFMPISVGLVISNKFNNKVLNIVKSALIFIIFMAGFAQGSDSVLLSFYALFLGLLIFSMFNLIEYKDILKVMILWGLSAQAIRLLRWIFTESYNYEADGLCNLFTTSGISLILLVLPVLFLVFFNEKTKKLLLILFILGAIIGIAYSFIIFNDSFGSGRGRIIRLTFMAFNEMNPLQKVLGVGPDCYADYIYSIPHIYEELKVNWPNDILANSHNEMLTMLINEGTLGAISYIFIFIAYIIKNFKVDNKIIVCSQLALLSYLIHNTVSFMQVLNFPFIFILFGMAQATKIKK